MSPWLGLFACKISPCATRVGSPVDGPPRITFTITSGISAIKPRPICSDFKEIPGPELAVIAFAPLIAAPSATEIPEISSSIWINVPLCFGKSTLIS